MKKKVSIILLVNMLFDILSGHLSFCSEIKTIVVIPVQDNVSDGISKDLAISFSDFFRNEGIDVVDQNSVEEVVGYYSSEITEKEKLTDNLKDNIVRAREHYYNFQSSEAISQIEFLIDRLEKENNLSENGELLKNSYISAALIFRSEKDGTEKVKSYLSKALKLDPFIDLNAKDYPPSIVQVLSELKKDRDANNFGEVSFDLAPALSEISVNGIKLASALPCVLPSGEYWIKIEANKYKAVTKKIILKSGDKIKVKESLKWAGESEISKKDPDINDREWIEKAIRISKLLKVDNAFLVDVDETSNGNGEVTMRLIDPQYEASYNPIIVRYENSRENLSKDISKALDLIAKQKNEDLLSDPKNNIDPKSVGDPVLFGKRGRSFHGSPLFWVLAGGGVAAIAGGVAAGLAASGGGKPATGSVNVQFR